MQEEIHFLVEISYGFSTEGYDSCAGYWDNDLNWHEGIFNPYGWMVEIVLKEIKNPMDKKVICLVIPSMQAGGMERVMGELARYFSNKPEVELHLVLYGINHEIFYTLPENIVIHKPQFRFNNTFRLYFYTKNPILPEENYQAIKPDTVLSFGEYWNNFVLFPYCLQNIRFMFLIVHSPIKAWGNFMINSENGFIQNQQELFCKAESKGDLSTKIQKIKY